jgi:hypothetical protein
VTLLLLCKATGAIFGQNSFGIKENKPKTVLEDFQTKCHEETVAALKISEDLKQEVQQLKEKYALLEAKLETCTSSGSGGGAVATSDGHKTIMSELYSHTIDIPKGKPLPFIGDHYPMDFNEEHMHVEVVGPSSKIEKVKSTC